MTYKRPLIKQVWIDLQLANAARCLYSAMCHVDETDPAYISARNAFVYWCKESLDPEVKVHECVQERDAGAG
jgi:hypothetical protein